MQAITRGIDAIVLSKYFAIPRPSGNRFQGREVELTEPHCALTQAAPAGQRDLKVVAVQG